VAEGTGLLRAFGLFRLYPPLSGSVPLRPAYDRRRAPLCPTRYLALISADPKSYRERDHAPKRVRSGTPFSEAMPAEVRKASQDALAQLANG
jgi:hypothetical protein